MRRPSPAPPPLAVILLHLISAAAAAAVSVNPAAFDYPTANLSTKWVNSPSHLPHTVTFPDGSTVSAILLRGSFGPSFAFGFYSPSSSSSFILAIFIVYTDSGSYITLPNTNPPQILWSPNRNRPVGPNSTLELSISGDLLLRDSDDSLVWSTNTSGRSVAAMNLTSSGELLLVGNNGGAPLWSSFDHPTDCLLPGQRLVQGQRLVSNESASNSSQGVFFVSVDGGGMSAFAAADPPQLYASFGIGGDKKGNSTPYAVFNDGGIDIYSLFTVPGSPDRTVPLKKAAALQYLRLDSDGHLRLYEWNISGAQAWSSVADALDVFPPGGCAYPTVCGDYGVCFNGQCSCPGAGAGDDAGASFFRPVDATQSFLGCRPATPLSCQSNQTHKFLPLVNVSYFNYIDVSSATAGISDEESCKEACLSNCSCKAALFQYGPNVSDGLCYLPSQLFSLMINQPSVSHYNSTAFLKVQLAAAPPPPPSRPANSPPTPAKSSSSVGIIVGAVLGGVSIAFLILCIAAWMVRRKRAAAAAAEDEEDGRFDQMPGMPTRFSYEELQSATKDFQKKLGQGGFGSVFAGELPDGTAIAVKRLDGVGQGKREFLAEVMTIGSVHHINLARLIGFCAERSHRLLVYEYMSNGSLDKWIFRGADKEFGGEALDWATRRKIIADIAKGLAYLHEECRQRIAHLDIKPQNILLDEEFNAKVSDFGLAKLIDRDQSQVVTQMRGTPGYLAPEWLTSVITEKVDVYSFGVVLMEIVCGRKNLDYSRPSETVNLIGMLPEMVVGRRLGELVDPNGPDMRSHEKEVVRIMELAMWCLQGDCSRRPSMSMVLKVLEGSMDVEGELDYNFFIPPTRKEVNGDGFVPSVPLIDSVLSGPR